MRFAIVAACIVVTAWVVPATSAAAPPNDNFAAATTLTGSSATASGTNLSATVESGEAMLCAQDPLDMQRCGVGQTVWYRWTALASGPTTVDTCSDDIMDTLLGVYSASSVASLGTPIATVNNQCGIAANYGSRLTFEAVAGTAYEFEIDGCCGAPSGSWTLTLNGQVPPPLPDPPDTTAPETTISTGPAKKTRHRAASFVFSSSEPGSSFHCTLNGAALAACASPVTIRAKRGRNLFAVRATDAAGNTDGSPAIYAWKFKKKRRHK